MSKKKKEILKEFSSIVVDKATGEILTEESHTLSKYPREPNFVKQYHADVVAMFGLPKICRNVLDLIVASMDYDNRVALFAPMKRDMANVLNVKTQSIEKAILKLNKAKVMSRIDRGMYRVNPYLYGKGEWKDIYKLRLTTNYSREGVKILGERITEEQERREAQERIKYKDSV